MQRKYSLFVALLLPSLLMGCATDGTIRTAPQVVSSGVGRAPSSSVPQAPSQRIGPEKELKQPVESSHAGELFRGTGRFIDRTHAKKIKAETTAKGDITLNFVNASIPDVAKAVLGAILKLNYTVAPSVQGTVTLQTSEPINRSAVLPALQTALRFAGATVVHAGAMWSVVPVADAPRVGELPRQEALARARTPGFSIEIVPLHYVGAEEMQRVLIPVVPEGSILRVDRARNLLILAGTAQELAAMRDQVATFDVDWLAGMSFALVPLKIANVKSVAEELRDILGHENSPIAGLVRIVPIERMNALLLISPQPDYLEKLRRWAGRLDHANEKAALQLYVYRVQNGRAKDLADVLRKVFEGENGSGVAGGVRSRSSALSGVTGQTMRSALTKDVSVLSRPVSAISAPGTSVAGGPSSYVSSATTRPGNHDGVAESDTVGGTGPQIIADEVDNALVIRATAAEYSAIQSVLKALDVAPLQVLIEASIAEVTLTKQLRYGVQYFLRSGNFNYLFTGTHAVPPLIPTPGFAVLFAASASNQIILDLLESITNVNVISAPELMVLNNQAATLQVGNEVPVATASAVSVETPGAPIVNSIEYRNTGIILKITPRVNESGLVLLDIAQEVSEVSQTTTSTLNSPTISQRRFTSSVAIRDGQTVALGGLISDSRTKNKSGIPFLRDLPFIGVIFGNALDAMVRTELLIMITPHIIRSEQDAHSITDEFRRRMRAVVPLEKRVR